MIESIKYYLTEQIKYYEDRLHSENISSHLPDIVNNAIRCKECLTYIDSYNNILSIIETKEKLQKTIDE